MERLVEYQCTATPFQWQWHAGEPLAVGFDSFVQCQDALETAFARFGPDVKVSLQTNGTLINERWARFFADRNIAVGVSIDGPPDIHDHKRRYRTGRGTHQATVRGLNHLIDAGIKPSALCVVGPHSLLRGTEIIQFFGTIGVRNLAFNFEEQEGENVYDAFEKFSTTDLRFAVSKFVRDVVAAREGYPSMRIREFDSFQLFLEYPLLRRPLMSDPFYCVTINYRGDVLTFSPELTGTTRLDGSAWSFGNIFEDKLVDILNRVTVSKDYREIKIGIEMCRNDCDYFSYCGGGAPGNKFFENGTFASPETTYCKMRYQFLVDAMLDAILAES